jgi:tRNA dimethylallyltransferase
VIYVILGQTASGKTRIALKLAREFSLPVISADAYQCYKTMAIGTDKPTREETAGLTYLYYDQYQPDEATDVASFQKTMRPLLDGFVAQGQDVLVVGGTFLYIKALLFNYVFPEESPEATEKYENLSLQEQAELLLKRSPETYQSIDHQNPRRVLSALRQLDGGLSRKEILAKNSPKPLYPVTFLRIDIDKDEGNQKIDARIDSMFGKGIVSEVEGLVSQYPKTCRSFLAIGYKEIIQGLEEKKTSASMADLIKIHTHQYAKKQRTFLRNQFPEAIGGSPARIEALIRNDIAFHQRSRIVLAPSILNRIETCSILFVGLGGVGGQALLALARLGVTRFCLMDGDKVEASNLNRQSLYDASDIGKDKAEVARKKILAINPLIQVTRIVKQVAVKEDIPSESYDVIVDCIDDCPAKGLLYEKALQEKSVYVTSLGMGFHWDSTKVRYGKMKESLDPLSKAFRQTLTQMGYNKTQIDDIDCVYASDGRMKAKANSPTIGSLATVPESAGLALVSLLLRRLEEENENGKRV